MKYVLLVIVSGVILAGCLNVETTIDLNRDGSGRMDISYEIDADLYHLGVFDDSDVALPIPVSREDFKDTADRNPGLRLRRYRVREGDDTITVSARLRFDSVAALNEWYGSGDAVTMTQTADSTVWTQLISPGGGAAGRGSEALAESLGGYSLRFLLGTPAPITAVTGGQISDDGRTASFTISLGDIAMMEGPQYWEVRW